jgi:translocation and assembly module TamA
MINILARIAVAAVLAAASVPVWGAITVIVDGLSGEEKANVEARLTIRQQANRDKLDRRIVRRLHRQAPEDVREALQPFGYYSPEIRSELSGAPPNWTAHYTIDAGAPTTVEALDIRIEGEGHDAEAIAEARDKLPIKLGERLRHARYEEAKSALMNAAFNAGYVDAHWTQSQLRVRPESRQAQLVLHLDTGPRYYFGEIAIDASGLDQDFIRRYLVMEPGDPFSPRTVLEQQFIFSDLGYFDTVEIEPLRDQAGEDHRLPMSITTTPRKRARYSFGVGYGTDTGARVSIGAEWRRLNARGHTANANLRLSQRESTLASEYVIPQGDRPGESLSFSAGLTSQELPDGRTDKYQVGAALNRLSKNWRRRWYLLYSHEKSDFGDETVTADLLTPGIALTRDKSDDPIRPTRGLYAFFDVHGAQEPFLSSATFLQEHVLVRGVYGVTPRLRVFGRAEGGWTQTQSFSELPATQRFFAGGDQSVRGYAYQSLAPKDDDGNVLGGRYLATFSVEGEYRIHGNIAGALFADAGGADDSLPPKLHIGVGPGLRYRVPIGDLRLDIGLPLDQGADPYRIHLGVRVGL